MFRIRFLLASLLFTSTFGACAEDEDIWMPPTADGKADSAVQILKGSDIPSQYVGANKHYLTSRRIDRLEALTALKDVMDSTAKRADGIIANLPANGRLDAAELVRMESSAIYPTLFPEEQQALPKLWELLETDGTLAPVAVPDVDLTITQQLTQPGGLTYPTSLLISSLNTDLQTVAKRVQLVFNADGNANTIQVADIDKVLADPQAFTPAEVTQLNAIKLLFTERATSTEEAKAKLPEPGQTSKTTTFGQMSLELVSNLVIHEHRQAFIYSYQQNWEVSLAFEQQNAVTLHAPASSKVLVVELDSGNETVYEGADVVYGNHPVGNVVVERYDLMGARQEMHELALPPFQAGMKSTLANDVIDFKLFNGATELQKNVYATTSSSNYWNVEARYEKTMTTAPSLNQSMLDANATPKSSLPTGRYEVPTANGNLAIDIYPEGVVMWHYITLTGRLLPGWSGQKAFVGSCNNQQIVFTPANNHLVGPGVNTTLTVAQRTK